MGTGASKARREAKKQAQAAYYGALKKTERIDELSKIDTQGARKLSDKMGENMSYRSKRLAMQADKVGRSLNQNRDEVNTKIGRYNDRFDEVQQQMNGENVDRYSYSLPGSGLIGSQGGQGQMYKSSEEALAAGSSVLSAQKTPYGLPKPTNPLRQQPTVQVNKVQEGPITTSYRTLPQTTRAYNELSTMAEGIRDNPTNKYSQQYEALGQKLKTQIQRDQRMATPQQKGLLNAELVSGSGPVAAETIG